MGMCQRFWLRYKPLIPIHLPLWTPWKICFLIKVNIQMSQLRFHPHPRYASLYVHFFQYDVKLFQHFGKKLVQYLLLLTLISLPIQYYFYFSLPLEGIWYKSCLPPFRSPCRSFIPSLIWSPFSGFRGKGHPLQSQISSFYAFRETISGGFMLRYKPQGIFISSW